MSRWLATLNRCLAALVYEDRRVSAVIGGHRPSLDDPETVTFVEITPRSTITIDELAALLGDDAGLCWTDLSARLEMQ